MNAEQETYLVQSHRYSFRSGEPAMITGVRWVEVNGVGRACFVIRYADEVTDFVPVDDRDAGYKFLSKSDVRLAHKRTVRERE